MRFDVFTIFPRLIDDFCSGSLLGRAQKEIGALQALKAGGGRKKSGGLEIKTVDIRTFARGRRTGKQSRHKQARHARVDDRPYGGGAGMVMKVEPVWRALKKLGLIGADGRVKKFDPKKMAAKSARGRQGATSVKGARGRRAAGALGTRVVLLSAKGRQFDDAAAKRLAKYKRVVLICGRYEGVDERVAKNLAHEELSIGPYVLQGGEIAALVVIEAASRYVKGVLGNMESVKEETRLSPKGKMLGKMLGKMRKEYPQYTRPEIFRPSTRSSQKSKTWAVPKILLSGDHKKIKEWRWKQSQAKAPSKFLSPV